MTNHTSPTMLDCLYSIFIMHYENTKNGSKCTMSWHLNMQQQSKVHTKFCETYEEYKVHFFSHQYGSSKTGLTIKTFLQDNNGAIIFQLIMRPLIIDSSNCYGPNQLKQPRNELFFTLTSPAFAFITFITPPMYKFNSHKDITQPCLTPPCIPYKFHLYINTVL